MAVAVLAAGRGGQSCWPSWQSILVRRRREFRPFFFFFFGGGGGAGGGGVRVLAFN